MTALSTGAPRLHVPTRATLAKYGLTLAAWKELARRQAGRCAVCGLAPRTGRLYVDHEHWAGWTKLPPAERVRAVRGLLDYQCNRFMVGRHCARTAREVARYLEAYETTSTFPGARR